MKKYKEYIDSSEATWFTSVPDNWRATKMRELFSQRNTKVSDKNYPALSVGKMGVVPQLDTAVKTDNGDNRKLICKGDFAINSRSDRKGSGGISKYDGSASLIITVLKPHETLNGEFYHYLLRSHYFSEEFYRNGRGLVSDLWTTRWDEMKNIYIPVPPRDEQDQIVNYLDWRVSEINLLIHSYQKQIVLLKERRVSVIDRLLTKGVHEGRTLHVTKAAWMGEIPVDWTTCRMKNLFSEINLRSADGLEPHLTMSQKYGLITDDLVIEKRLVSENYIGAKVCHKDDLVLNRLKAHLGVFALSPLIGVVSPDYTVLRLNTKMVIPQFAEYLLKSNACRGELKTRVRGIVEGFWRLYTDDLGAIPVSIPALKEQREILDSILMFEERYQKLVGNVEKEIKLLREYRTRLISDVVTGQVDVRDVIIPDYTVEEDIEDALTTDDTDNEVSSDE